MKKKDVASISYKTAFNKTWWESKRSSKVKGCGVGNALDRWQKNSTSSTSGVRRTGGRVLCQLAECGSIHRRGCSGPATFGASFGLFEAWLSPPRCATETRWTTTPGAHAGKSPPP